MAFVSWCDRDLHPHILRELTFWLIKQGADSSVRKSYGLAGRLYLTQSGWLMLSVPNALVRGAFDALNEPGVELPSHQGRFDAHITVMTDEEVKRIGADNITERGHIFRYTLGKVYEVTPRGSADWSKVWCIEVRSPELERLRRSYGLSSLPSEGQVPFHITIAIRKRNVIRKTPDSKSLR